MVEFGGIEPNPHFETLMKAVEIVREQNITFMLAVGGGSVIDGVKFISAAVKFEGNPILHRTGGLEGVGHHAFFKDAKGRNRIVFHSHNRPGKIHPRIIHIRKYRFRKVRNAPDRLVIDEEFLTPQMK